MSSSNTPNPTVILVLGILSIVCCQILGPVAWIMGKNAQAQLEASGMASEANLAKIGMICGIVGSILLIINIIWVVGFGGLAVLSGMSGGRG